MNSGCRFCICLSTSEPEKTEKSGSAFSQLWTCRLKIQRLNSHNYGPADVKFSGLNSHIWKIQGLNSQNSCFLFLKIQAQNSSKIILAFHSACHADAATVWVLSSQGGHYLQVDQLFFPAVKTWVRDESCCDISLHLCLQS